MKNLSPLKQYNLVIIRYNEIWLKSTKVRIRMLKILMNNTKDMLLRAGVQFNKYQMSRDSTRIYFFFKNANILKAIEVLKKVFGTYSFSPALRTSINLKNISERTIEIGNEILEKGDSFALRVKRSGNHEFNSKEVAIKVGQDVMDHFQNLNLKVNLSSPKKRIFIEIRNDFSYVYTNIIKNEWGGLPIERQKKVLVMDVGRLNDLLAGFLLMKRGCEIYPFLFKLTNDDNDFKIRKLNWSQVREFTPHSRFFLRTVNLVDILNEILERLPSKESICGICRLLRFDILSRILKSSNNNSIRRIRAITDGASLNDLTPCSDEIDLKSIGLNPLFSDFPVFTPVIGLDSVKINELLFKISKNLKRVEYCQFKPVKQNHQVNIEELRKLYESLKLNDLILDSLNNLKQIIIN